MTESKPTPKQTLRYERERRGWSQLDLADKIGTTPLNVGRWERGVTLPGPHFRQKLSDVFEKTAQELGLLPEPVATATAPEASHYLAPTIALAQEPPTSLWNVPYNRNLLFTGREDILAHLAHAFLNEPQPVALTQPQAISGLGGIGKTQSAVEYAYRYREQYDAVLWARADSPDLLSSDFLLIAALLNLPQRNEQDQSVVVKAVIHWFDTHEKWLLILDNADDLLMVSEFLPSAGKGHVLLTTRAHSTGTMAQRIEIDKMGLDEGMLFLLRRMKRLKGNTGLASVPETTQKQAQAIVEALDSLPLALDQAGAYIEETGCSLSDYLKFYQMRRKRLLRMRGHNATGHPEPVATTWALSFEKVERAYPAAADLLRLCAFLHPDEIPESMFVDGASELGPHLQPVAEDELDWNEAIGELRKYSLVKRDPEKKILNIHRLVQTVIRDGMKEAEESVWAERVVHTVAKVYPIGNEFVAWATCQKYLPHAQLCIELIERRHMKSIEVAQLLNNTGTYLSERGKYSEAEPLLQQALLMREQLLGLEDASIADVLNNLGIIYWMQGHPEQTILLLQRAILIQEKALGPLHAKLAESLNNLGVMYGALDRRIEAISLYERAIAIWEQVLSHDDPTIAYAIANLAVVYDDLGRYTEAEQLYKRALDLRVRLQGEEHPEIGTILNNLAVLYRSMKRYEEAHPLLEKNLIFIKNTMGAEHPRVGTSLDNLAQNYRDLGMHEKAEATFKEALALRQRISGPEHPRTAFSLHGLATVYRLQRKYDLSESLFQQALVIREKAHGQEHTEVAATLHELALLYVDRERYAEAEPLYERALAIREQKLGMSHPDVATTLEKYAFLLRKTNREDEATALEARAQAIRAKQE